MNDSVLVFMDYTDPEKVLYLASNSYWMLTDNIYEAVIKPSQGHLKVLNRLQTCNNISPTLDTWVKRNGKRKSEQVPFFALKQGQIKQVNIKVI